MPGKGAPSTLGTGGRSTAVRENLVSAAIDALREEGYLGATARNIAARAGCNPGLVFYHYGSVVNLLLAAVDEVSNRRMAEYQRMVEGASDLPKLVEAAAQIFREDLDSGYLKVLAEMISATSSTPGLGDAIAERIRPWRRFTEAALGDAIGSSPVGAVVPVDVVAHAVVALYLGLEMLASLDGDREPTEALFAHAGQLANLLSMVTPEVPQ